LTGVTVLTAVPNKCFDPRDPARRRNIRRRSSMYKAELKGELRR